MFFSVLRAAFFPLFAACCMVAAAAPPPEPLPSWNDGVARQAIVAFVERVTRQGAADFVPPAERIAVFDNDGTLWPENPLPFQAAFILDELKRLAPERPEWQDNPVIAAALAGDVHAIKQGGVPALAELLAATHSGMTVDEFNDRVRGWLDTARHPRFGRPYHELVYQPMLELLDYLRANGFTTYIVSGGGADFMRVWAEDAYGIPPDQVIGSYGKARFELRDGKPVLLKEAGIELVDDKAGKPVGIHRFIGRQPIACFGNSDGDLEMLQWTTIGQSPSFGLIVHHTDAEREYAYDAAPKSSGKLVRALEEANARGWTVVDMRRDWKTIFPAASSATIPVGK
jgi:phosphoglycolate phosphatase-like HAD superfamily hydrolase